MLKKIVFSLFIIFLFAFNSSEAALFHSDISKSISQNEISNNATVSVVVKNKQNGKLLYQKNKDKAQNPASSLKLLTFAAILDQLGENYNFETAFYIDENKNVYLKLGADPTLTTKKLSVITAELSKKIKNINNFYIDDSIISSDPYPEGWMSDDYLYMPKITPYIINGGTSKVRLSVSNDKKSVNISQNGRYRFTIINELEIGKDDFEILKNEQNGDILTLRGTISKDTELEIPINNAKYFFIMALEDALSSAKIQYNKRFYFKQVPDNAKKIAAYKTPIKEISKHILFNSDNFATEVAFRVAGGAYVKKCGQNKKAPYGTTKAGIEMFKAFYRAGGLNVDDINLTDGSGVSRYDTMSAIWLANAIDYADNKTNIRNYLESAGEGTLSKRLRYLKGSIYAKTGTHKGLSSLCGIIKTRKGKDVVFAIIVSDLSSSTSRLKALEDDIVDAIFEL